MKKNALKILILLFLIVLVSTVIIYLKGTFKKETAQENQSEQQEQKIFRPESLDWIEATSSANWESRDSFAAVVFKGKMWIFGGLDANANVKEPNVVEYWKATYFDDIWSSTDGINWQLEATSAPWGKRRSSQIAEFNGKLWMTGGWGPGIGLKNDVWSSDDGINWTLVTENAEWPGREGHQLFVYDGKLWINGGVRYDERKTLNDVWYSNDGTNWTLATDSAEWSGRWDHSITVFNGKLWLMGGMDLKDNIFNDIWSSDDGINWDLVTNSAPWQTRQGFGSVVYENRLWIIGRFNDILNGGNNDVWFTDDGIVWKKTDADPAWPGREDMTALIFNNRLWIFGGMASQWNWVNDVWYSTSSFD
jgi:hypothetical protein